MENHNTLVQTNDFEKLVAKIQEENLKDFDSGENKGKRRDIIRAIASVYHFLTHYVGMKERPLTVEEFEIAEAKLLQMAQTEIKKPKQKFLAAIGLSLWNYYLAHGYFPKRRTPFGKWSGCMHIWRKKNYYNFDPAGDLLEGGDRCVILPRNVRDLERQLLEKKYGNKERK